ncbi:MAG: oxygen-independent coproporphyrinogen III oxidase [Salaquimonas sp.]
MLDLTNIIKNHTTPVPRYTSYPTAPHFQPDLGLQILTETLVELPAEERLSLYLHIPFCDRLCWFCGCNTKQVNRYSPVSSYIDALLKEIELIGLQLGGKRKAEEIHFGGGSPSLLYPGDFARLSLALNKAFLIDESTKVSVEIDPNDATPDLFQGLKIIRMSRASIGVQDFDSAVQKAINRPQTFEDTRALVEQLRSSGINSINIDALYGLPLQTKPKLQSTIEKIISMQPNRVALFGYAHVPWVKKHQKMIRDEDLPKSQERFEQAQLAQSLLIQAGYVKIGIDHYAKPDDSLAIAAKTGELRRNFQGYTDDKLSTLIGLGGSSIGQSNLGYFQNLVPTGQYTMAVNNGLLPTSKGYRFTQDDKIRSWIIEQLMCNFSFSFEKLIRQFGNLAQPYIGEAIEISKRDSIGVCETVEDRFTIRPEAEPLTRIIASKFDAHLGRGQFKYSQAV